MTKVYVDIGSNINRDTHICACIKQLRKDFSGVVFSKPYESKAEGFVGGDFINLSAGFETDMPYEELREYLKDLERKQNRVRNGEKFVSRTVDVDILLFGNEILKPVRDVPRAEILKFPFVLYPLSEIAADVMHPELQKTIKEIADDSGLDRSKIWSVELSCF